MCGIGGIVQAHPEVPVPEAALRRMAAALRHRGPDGWGLALDAGAGLVTTRLAIFDLEDGWQPLAADRSVIAYNGEVYNHPELGADLPTRTRTDTEVVLRLLERDGVAALDRFNGQFALAWWEPDARRLTLARDRFGVRPLHYTVLDDGSLAFASEARGLFAAGVLEPEPDLDGLDEVFTLWGPQPPRTAFRGVRALPPGGLLVWERGRIVQERAWWAPEFGPEGPEGDLTELLRDSVRLRLRADVPVGTYLSGGLDSSLITALASEVATRPLRTFSVAFDDPRYDEGPQQREVAAALGTEHTELRISPADIADAFALAVEHAETPLVRTAPAPLGLLAEATRANGVTVVATGEGADELFWGYDLFKEVELRRAQDWAGLDALYPTLGDDRRGEAWRRAFADAGPADDPLFSHQTRINATGIVKAFYRPEVAAAVGDPLERLRAGLPEAFGTWSPLERASWLELRTLLEPYLLSAQADRVAMAHGVEARFPLLDHRVFEHAARLPAHRKLDGMRDKIALRDVAGALLAPEIAGRRKQPYRAPEVAPFFAGDASPEWVTERLSAAAVDATGVFDPARVEGLLRRCRVGRVTGARESMALVGVLSTQLWHERCVRPRTWPEEHTPPRVRLDLQLQPSRSPA